MPLFLDTLNLSVTPEGITDSFDQGLSSANNLLIYEPQKLKDAFREFGRTIGGKGKFVTKVAASTKALASGLLSSLAADGVGAFYRFVLNPQAVNVDESKLDTIVVTKAGHDTMHWEHDDTIKIRYDGVSGSLVPPLEATRLNINDVRLSAAWRRFEQFKRFWRASRRDMVIIWEGTYYRGIMKTFNYKRSAEGPWLINYSFDFTALPDQTRDLFGKDLSVASLLGLSAPSIRRLLE